MKPKSPRIFSGWTTLAIFCFQVFFAIGITIMPAKVYAAVPSPQFLLTFNGDFTDRS